MIKVNSLASNATLSAEELLAGANREHEIEVPPALLHPRQTTSDNPSVGVVRIKALDISTLSLISKAAHEEPSLVPLLIINKSLLEPKLSLEQIKRLHVGLVHFLIAEINQLSGLSADGDQVQTAAETTFGHSHLLLAKHFGWTPEQVSQLTPGQVAVYLAGIERFVDLHKEDNRA